MLKDHQDASGHGIYDAFLGDEVDEVMEREDGYVDVSEVAKSYLAEFKEWPTHQQRAMRHAWGRVLDIGCGGGRSLYLQEKGLDVLGIDNPPMVSKPELEGILQGTGWKARKYINGPGGVYCMVLDKEENR